MLWSHSSFRLTSSPLAGVWGSWGGWEPAPPRDTPDPRVLRGKPRLLSSSLPVSSALGWSQAQGAPCSWPQPLGAELSWCRAGRGGAGPALLTKK